MRQLMEMFTTDGCLHCPVCHTQYVVPQDGHTEPELVTDFRCEMGHLFSLVFRTEEGITTCAVERRTEDECAKHVNDIESNLQRLKNNPCDNHQNPHMGDTPIGNIKGTLSEMERIIQFCSK